MKRLLPSFIIAVLINFVLFFIMKALVNPKHLPFKGSEVSQTITFIQYESPQLKPETQRLEIKADVVPEKIPESEPISKASPPKKNRAERRPEVIKAEGVPVVEEVADIESKVEIDAEAMPVEPVARPVLLSKVKSEPEVLAAPKKTLSPLEMHPTTSTEVAIETDVAPLVRIPPHYPRWALRSKIIGSVVIRFTITPEGWVSEPLVIKSEPNEVFDRSALRALKQWKFKPLLRNGRPIARRAIQRFSFALRKG